MNEIATGDGPDRVLLSLRFDPGRLISCISNLGLREYIYYDVIPLTAPAHLLDPSLPEPPAGGNFADGSWTDWQDTKALRHSSYLLEVVENIRRHTTVTLVRVLRLAAGAAVPEHTDPTLGLHIEDSVVRLTIPVLCPDHCIFYLNNAPVSMQPGECWYLRLTDPHRIENASHSERIHLTIDCIPNAWVRDQIAGAAGRESEFRHSPRARCS